MDLVWLIPALCVGAFFVNVVITRQIPSIRQSLAAGIALGATGLAVVVFLIVFADAVATPEMSMEHPHLIEWSWFAIGSFNFPIVLVADWLTIVMLGMVSFLSFLIQFYSIGYMQGHQRFWWFFSVIALFTGAMLTLVVSYNLLITYMAWELVGLCSFLLIGFYHDRRSAAEAAKKAFVTTRVGDVGLFIGMITVFECLHICILINKVNNGTQRAINESLIKIFDTHHLSILFQKKILWSQKVQEKCRLLWLL